MRHNIGTAFCVADCNAVHESKRGIVVKVRAARAVADYAAVTMIGILAGTDIGDYHDFWDMCLDLPYSLLDNPVWVMRCALSFRAGTPKSSTAWTPESYSVPAFPAIILTG